MVTVYVVGPQGKAELVGWWVDGWMSCFLIDRKVEEDEAVRMRYWKQGVEWVGGKRKRRWVGGWEAGTFSCSSSIQI